MVTILLIIALLIAIVAVIFALQNTAMVVVTFFAWQFEQSLALVLLITIIVGVLIGVLTILPGSLRSKWRLSSQRRKLDTMNKMLQDEVGKREALESQLLALQTPPPPVPVPVPPANTQAAQADSQTAEPSI